MPRITTMLFYDVTAAKKAYVGASGFYRRAYYVKKGLLPEEGTIFPDECKLMSEYAALSERITKFEFSNFDDPDREDSLVLDFDSRLLKNSFEELMAVAKERYLIYWKD